MDNYISLGINNPKLQVLEKWPNKEMFIDKLTSVQNQIKHNNFIPYKKSKKCIFNDDDNVTTGYYNINNIKWEDGLLHYIKNHNVVPANNAFIEYIFNYKNEESKPIITGKINGISIVKNDKKYLKLDRNQILILDALMEHGGYKIYKSSSQQKKIYKYSEHAGLLDFNTSGLEKIIISGNTTRVDLNDDDIFLPKNMIDAFDYEYIFHTHPPTPRPGGRAKEGILYEFPSVSDLFHFKDHYNGGRTQGSIVVAPEGMYIIRKKIYDNKKININEDMLYKNITKIMAQVQDMAIDKYGVYFSREIFFSQIAQDTVYINMINKVLNKYKMHIDYYPRIKDNKNHWVIDTIYLPVYVIEPGLVKS